MSTQKLLVLFPGIGYTCGTGLLAAGAARGQAAGYTVLPLAYSAQTAAQRADLDAAACTAQADVGAQLAAVDWGAYTDIVFLSKSLGTVVAARSLRQLGVAARSLYLTPLAGALAAVRPGDTVLGMSLPNGGHLTHGSPVNLSGKYFHFVAYNLDEKTERIDYDEVRRLALKHKPKLIVAGASAYARAIDFAKFREIADEVGAMLMVDMAHIAGLVAAGEHMSPVPYADVVTTTTHKTLRGPRGGLILCKEEYAKAIDKAIFPGTQGGPLMHIIAAKAVCLGEALKPEFKDYAKRVVENAQALAGGLCKRGFQLVSGGTDNHLMLVDLRSFAITGKELEKKLDEVYITVNKNAIPNDPEKPFVTSGIRVGTPAVTSRGFTEEDMKVVGRLICQAAQDDFTSKVDDLRVQVKELTGRYPLYQNV